MSCCSRFTGKTLFSGKNLGYDVYREIMGEELFKQKIEEFEKVSTWNCRVILQAVSFATAFFTLGVFRLPIDSVKRILRT